MVIAFSLKITHDHAWPAFLARENWRWDFFCQAGHLKTARIFSADQYSGDGIQGSLVLSAAPCDGLTQRTCHGRLGRRHDQPPTANQHKDSLVSPIRLESWPRHAVWYGDRLGPF